ncbi:MAG: hypothetical protein D6701_02685, partial [Gemmatimonadetes bacterium]
MSADGGRGAPETRRLMARAVRRLDALETALLLGAAVLALAGGALAAWLLRSAAGFPFWPSWVVASLLLFVVPGLVAYGRHNRAPTHGGGEGRGGGG